MGEEGGGSFGAVGGPGCTPCSVGVGGGEGGGTLASVGVGGREWGCGTLNSVGAGGEWYGEGIPQSLENKERK